MEEDDDAGAGGPLLLRFAATKIANWSISIRDKMKMTMEMGKSSDRIWYYGSSSKKTEIDSRLSSSEIDILKVMYSRETDFRLSHKGVGSIMSIHPQE